jgi:hypothetical protein
VVTDINIKLLQKKDYDRDTIPTSLFSVYEGLFELEIPSESPMTFTFSHVFLFEEIGL